VPLIVHRRMGGCCWMWVVAGSVGRKGGGTIFLQGGNAGEVERKGKHAHIDRRRTRRDLYRTREQSPHNHGRKKRRLTSHLLSPRGEGAIQPKKRKKRAWDEGGSSTKAGSALRRKFKRHLAGSRQRRAINNFGGGKTPAPGRRKRDFEKGRLGVS